jgi:exosortase H (IPTLxxWG-CTERM-specific)
MGGKGKTGKRKTASEKKSAPKKFSLKKIPWALLKIYILFGLALVFFFLLFASSFFSKKVLEPFTTFVAFASSKILNVFGSWTYVSGTNLSSKDFGIDIVYGCNGVFATAILVSGIIAYPCRIREKLIGILIGIPAIFAINQVRVISLFLLGKRYPGVFEGVHVYVWQPIIILFAVLVWDFWARNFVKKDKIQKSPVLG